MRSWIAAGIAGLCLGLAPIDTLPGHLMWLVALVALGRTPQGQPVTDLLRGALVGVLWYGLSLRWVALQWVDLDGSLSLPLVSWVGVTLVQAVVPAVGAGLAGALVQRGWPRGLALPLAWIAASTLAPWVQPLPGGLAVYGAALQPLLWPAAWLGIPGFLALAGLCSAWLGARPAWGLPLLAVWLTVGLVPELPGGNRLVVGVVQPNTGAFDGRRASTASARADKLVQLVQLAWADGAEVVLTPETAWPTPLDLRRPRAARDMLRAFGGGPVVVLGAAVSDGEPPTNSLLWLERGEVLARQDKVHLVPVSEQRFFGLGRDVFRPGAGRVLLGDELAGLVCYEDLVPRGARGLGAATWVVAASNDAWLGPGPGARQHEGAARLSAVRSARWLVRPTANGHSAVFDPSGRRVWSAPWVDGDLHPDGGVYGVVSIERRRPVWAGADTEPWLGLLAALLLVPATWAVRPGRRRDPRYRSSGRRAARRTGSRSRHP